MELIQNFLQYPLVFLLVLTTVVFVHELGHYLAAISCGVKVEAFSIGFGPELFGFNDRRGTRWQFCLLPLGGFVKMYGEEASALETVNDKVVKAVEEVVEAVETKAEKLHLLPEHSHSLAHPTAQAVSDSSPQASQAPAGSETAVTPPVEKAKNSFQHKKLWQRSLIIVAGPLANYIFAIIVLAFLFCLYGQPFNPPIVNIVDQGSVAEQAGILPNDEILQINDTHIARFEEIVTMVQVRPNEELAIKVLRNGENKIFNLKVGEKLRKDVLGNEFRVGYLGVRKVSDPDKYFTKHPPAEALWQAMREVYSISANSLKAFSQIIMGVRDVSDLSGPFRIAKMSGDVIKLGYIEFIRFIAVISVSIGLVNLFPIPVMDGGHLLFNVFEAVFGRPISEKVMRIFLRIGLSFLFTMMAVAVWNDFVQLGWLNFLGKGK
ncbi:MAG: RIP metalloprotease RseP [Alphaproteobacteria bacterium]